MRKEDDEKQERIKQAVMHLILEQGLTGTSISKIAREAGVSPATVYVYYENKDEMLRDIYTEYSEEIFGYMTEQTRPEMDARSLVRTLMESYYYYIRDHREVYSFVEQFSHCPALACQCSGRHDMCSIFSLIDQMKAQGKIRSCSNEALEAVMFFPIKAVALHGRSDTGSAARQLEEIIELVQYALIPDDQ